MIMLYRVISASLSPNTEPDDVWRAAVMMVTPWRWLRGDHTVRVADWFRARFRVSRVSFFDSGRSSLLALLIAFGIGKGDEVIVQAFTCVAVPNSVLWAGAAPVFADIDETYNIDVSKLERRITKKTRAVIVQHTFGIPADMKGILAIARKHRIAVIEDCAHALGTMSDGAPAGSVGDAAFMSFGRDKSLSSVWGGAAMIRDGLKKENEALRRYADGLPNRSMFWVFQQLLHPLAFACIIPLYSTGLGKMILVVLQRLGLLSMPVYPEEKHGGKPPGFPSRYPNALAYLLMGQLDKLERYTDSRRKIAAKYRQAIAGLKGVRAVPDVPGASYLRFPVRMREPDRVIAKARKHAILLGNWYRHTIDPSGVIPKAIGYVPGSCPAAEKAASEVVNLPTRVTPEEAEQVLVFFRTIL